MTNLLKALMTIAVAALISGAGYSKGGSEMAFTLNSPDFTEGEEIPRMFTCEGDDMSPELRWESPPEGTKSFVLIADDPDAPMGTFTHWVLYDIPGGVKRLEQGLGNDPDLTGTLKHGKTDFGKEGYGGPCPPKGHGRHRYYFTVKALDVETLGIAHGASRKEVEESFEGHVLGEAGIMGTYER